MAFSSVSGTGYDSTLAAMARGALQRSDGASETVSFSFQFSNDGCGVHVSPLLFLTGAIVNQPTLKKARSTLTEKD
jgi:hypothetical protein